MDRPIRFALLLTILALAFAAGLPPSFAAAPVNVGDKAPDFSLPDLKGNSVSLSGLRGKVVLLNFWGTFCGPCRKEMPDLERAHTSLQTKGFTVLALSIDRSASAVASFLERVPVSFPVLLDTDKIVYSERYGTFALPLSFLIDKKGVVVLKFFGAQPWDSKEFAETVRELAEQ